MRTHCETFDSTTQLMIDRGVRTHVVFKTDQDDRALSLIAAGLGVALMPALFDAENIRKVKVRDFHTERIIVLEWNTGTVDERLSKLIAYMGSYNWNTATTLAGKRDSSFARRAGSMPIL